MPVVRKPAHSGFFNFDEGNLLRIREAYGLSAADAFLPFLIDGETCTLLEVRSETSRKAVIEDGSRRYFLKQIPWYADAPRQLSTSHRLQCQLLADGAPVAGLVASLAGDTWLAIDGGKFALFEFCAGYRFSGTPAQRSAAAAALVRVHECVVALPDALNEDWFSLVGDHLRLAVEIRGDDGAARRLVGRMDAELAHSAELARRAAWHALPDVPVHGDFNPWNVLFDADGAVRAVVDFDNCDTGKRVRDVAEGVLTFCGLRYAGDSTTFAQPFRADIHEAAAIAFLSSYQQAAAHPLSAGELSCVGVALRLAFLELASLGLIRGEVVAQRDAEYIVGWLGDPPLPGHVLERVANA